MGMTNTPSDGFDVSLESCVEKNQSGMFPSMSSGGFALSELLCAYLACLAAIFVLHCMLQAACFMLRVWCLLAFPF
jgi:hypothetical protein